ncbi:DNA/RNA nuclease SfsA [Fusobacterium sp. MFO224]|uniref:DNA/RNA nuclease SfsA n=1 Tax=Fusobacterium sp. MFO224 TaxID=3378070 RepID=UPI0038528766
MEKKIYEIGEMEEGIFLERPNRFVCKVKLANDEEVLVHVHDSGRIKELLYTGNIVKIKKAKNLEKRKTEWDLISAKAEDGEDILLNSIFHRYISENILNDAEISPFGKIDFLKAEVKKGHSRLDYFIEKNNKKIWLEVKGASLVKNKEAIFPDAPSIRASKHLDTLVDIIEEGENASVMFLVFRNCNFFSPNWETDKIFSEKFYRAMDKGVKIFLIQLKLKNGNIYYVNKKINIKQLGKGTYDYDKTQN